MKTLCFFLISCASSCVQLFSCPTCIGLPRPHERPFFERTSFLTAVAEEKTTGQKNTLANKKESGKLIGPKNNSK